MPTQRYRVIRIDRAASDQISCLQIVYAASDPYGLADDDSQRLGLEYVAVKLEDRDDAPYFTMPLEDLEPLSYSSGRSGGGRYSDD